jgi:hypothetical protein
VVDEPKFDIVLEDSNELLLQWLGLLVVRHMKDQIALVDHLSPLIWPSWLLTEGCFPRPLPACAYLEPWWFGRKSGKLHAQVVSGEIHSIDSVLKV